MLTYEQLKAKVMGFLTEQHCKAKPQAQDLPPAPVSMGVNHKNDQQRLALRTCPYCDIVLSSPEACTGHILNTCRKWPGRCDGAIRRRI